MKVLLSIRPEYALKIFDGSKKYEYRRVIFKRNDVSKIVVYASAPISALIGEFEIEEVLSDSPAQLWSDTKDFAGISKDGFFEYFSDKAVGHAIKVKTSKKYRTAKPLAGTLGVHPPQSFVYVD